MEENSINNKRTYLETEEEKEKAKEETEKCERCGAPDECGGFINCGSDCIFHKPRKDEQHTQEEGLSPCKCTSEDKRGVIQSRDYCAFKKTSISEDLNLDDLEYNFGEGND